MPIVGQFGSLAGFGVFPGGAFESIATITVGSGGASEAVFALIPSTYQHLQIRTLERSSNTAGPRPRMRFNSDTAANYSIHLLAADGASTAAAATVSATLTGGGAICTTAELANTFATSIIDILDYSSTSKAKTVRQFSGVDYNVGTPVTGQVNLWSGAWYSTAAIDTIRCFYGGTGGNFVQHCTFALYGIKAP
jgi:hypothetical protein